MSQTCLSSNCSSYLSGSGAEFFANSLGLLFTAQCLLTEQWPEDLSMSTDDLQFDYIIVGAGSAGAVVANRLSEDACRRVLLIEAGGDPPIESVVPALEDFLLNTPADWSYKTENDGNACQGNRDGRCVWPRGKMLGGSSSINGMLYVRGHRNDYDDFEKAGNKGWNYANALKYFKKSENLSDPVIENDPEQRIYHNFDGLLGVSTYTINNPLEGYIGLGYEEIGYDTVDDINGATEHGYVSNKVTVKDGKRESTARAYLVTARDRENLVIFKHSLVTQIIIEDNVATSVVIRLENQTEIIANATKEIIVSAGVINSPQLLMLSGIGPRKQLEELDIPVISDLPVGQNLHDHLNVPIIVTTNVGAQDTPMVELAYEVAQYTVFQKGFFAQRGFSHSPFITSCLFTDIYNPTDTSAAPNIHFYHINFSPNSAGLHDYCAAYAGFNDEICSSMIAYNKNNQLLTILPELLNAKSRGNITLVSKDPSVHPKIYTNYLTHEHDVDVLLKGIELVEKLVNTSVMQQAGAKLVRLNITVCKDYDFPSVGYWKCILHQMAATGYHPMGTCKMGPADDRGAVVDPELLVYGVEHLRVVDASVLPNTVSGNINAPVIMFAERASDLIKETHKDEECDAGNVSH